MKFPWSESLMLMNAKPVEVWSKVVSVHIENFIYALISCLNSSRKSAKLKRIFLWWLLISFDGVHLFTHLQINVSPNPLLIVCLFEIVYRLIWAVNINIDLKGRLGYSQSQFYPTVTCEDVCWSIRNITEWSHYRSFYLRPKTERSS